MNNGCEKKQILLLLTTFHVHVLEVQQACITELCQHILYLHVRSTSYMNMNGVTDVCMHICTRRSKIFPALLMPYDMLCVQKAC